ncbi:hypothetical protein [Nonomuraea sp. NPDC049028]|uniref:hypothetical protein n=1 Tax=Nonomuraea sp. NPDC049028 TaxID=3364348 RepID=UPI003719F6ED
MSFFMYDLMGETIDEPDADAMRRVLDGLAEADDERVVSQRVHRRPAGVGEH